MVTRYVGDRIRRVEDDRLVHGNGRFVDDLLPDALSAAVVRSPVAHARIVGIDTTRARELPGVHAVWTFDDVSKWGDALRKPLPTLMDHAGLTDPRMPYILAKDYVHHVGEAIVFVVANSRYLAEDACELVDVEFEALEPIVGIERALEASTTVHSDMESNVAASHSVGNVHARETVADSELRLSLKLSVERSAATPMEPRGVAARFEEALNRLQIWSSTQTTTGVRRGVSALLGLAAESVDVVSVDVGGGFGVKIQHPWPEEVLVSLSAMRLRRPVKFIEDRREHFISAAHERRQVHNVDVAFDENGRVLAMTDHFVHDTGAFTPFATVIPMVTAIHLNGQYKIPELYVSYEVVYTNTVMVIPYRGAGRPQACFVVERVMDAIAQHLHVDPAVVRERNLIQLEEFPYTHSYEVEPGKFLTYDSGNYPELWRKAKELIRWDDRESVKVENQGRLIGFGIAGYVEVTGTGPYEGARIDIDEEGSVRVATGIPAQGQGHETVFAQVVAEALGVEPGDVTVVTGDTREMAYGIGTFGSRGAVMAGSAVAVTASKVRANIVSLAADVLEASPDDLILEGGRVSVAGAPEASLSFRELAQIATPQRYSYSLRDRAANRGVVGLNPRSGGVGEAGVPRLGAEEYFYPSDSPWASGVHAVVIAIDPETCGVDILRYVAVHDCGVMINPMIVEGQVVGGIAQGLGGVLLEKMEYDSEGQLLNASFMDFLLPLATDMPEELVLDHVETASPLNPMGLKGAGEAGLVPSGALFASAFDDALGGYTDSVPVFPSALFQRLPTDLVVA